MESWFSQKEETNGGVESFFSYKEDREESVFRGKKKKINVKWKNEGQFWMFSGLFYKNNQNINAG